MVAYYTGSDPIEIGDPWSKVKVTMTQYPFYLYNSLLTSIIWISGMVCPIKMKSDVLHRYALGKFVVEFHKNGMGDDVFVTSFKFSPYNCPYLNFC